MPQLPQNKHLPIHLLMACFNKTSATYKFYWLLSIIQTLETGKTIIYKKELFARMISSAWYTVNYFHVSFGKQDQLQRAIENIRIIEKITVDATQESIVEQLINSENHFTASELKYFNNQVPHWFLSPWYPKSNKSQIEKASQDFLNNCPYALHKEFIQVNVSWVNYFLENASLIKDFCYWNLVVYLQSKNPNVPDIPNKIIKPALRNSLIGQRKKFWDIVLQEKGSVQCIYTSKDLVIGDYAVEHFIPYSFVSHDLIWNLIPADKSFNSKKSDKLPSLDKYFSSFFSLQVAAIEIIREKQPRNQFLQEYLTIFPEMEDSSDITKLITYAKYKEKIQPLISIAANNGFEFL